MRGRLAAYVVVAALAAAAVPGHAAAPRPQITDLRGDANAVNDQGLGDGSTAVLTPAEVSSADITAVTFASTFKKKRRHHHIVRVPTGFTVTMTLAAAPSAAPPVIYRVSADTASCATSVFFEYTSDGDTEVRCPDADVTQPATTYGAPPATVKGHTITWRLSTRAFRAGTTFRTLLAETRQLVMSPVVTVTAPVYDQASTKKTFTVGK